MSSGKEAYLKKLIQYYNMASQLENNYIHCFLFGWFFFLILGNNVSEVFLTKQMVGSI